MKKGLRKLILSGTALAAVAATLGTSTYAWYTTNPTVSANNILGASSDTGSSSIYIAKDTTAATKNWSSSVTFADAEFMVADKNSKAPGAEGYINTYASNLLPVQPSATVTTSEDTTTTTYTAGAFKTLDGSDAAANSVLKVTLWFKSSKTADEFIPTGDNANGIPLYLKSISVSQKAANTSALPTADNLLYTGTTGTSHGVNTAVSTYSVDIRRALAMEVTDATATETFVQAFGLADYKSTDFLGTVTSGDAHGYYNAVMPKVKDANNKLPGQEGYIPTDPLSSTAITAGKALTGSLTKTPLVTLNPTGTNDTAKKLNFYIYLNGWNDFCYDACQGQQFTVNMEFTKNVADALGA